MMDPADTEAPPVANFSINRLGHSVIQIDFKSKIWNNFDWSFEKKFGEYVLLVAQF